MFRVYRQSIRTDTKIVTLVPINANRYQVIARIQWRPRLQVWDAVIMDPSIPHMGARMANAKTLRTDSLLDAAAFAASHLAHPFTWAVC